MTLVEMENFVLFLAWVAGTFYVFAILAWLSDKSAERRARNRLKGGK